MLHTAAVHSHLVWLDDSCALGVLGLMLLMLTIK
jgi:hypothetical protein